MKRTIFLLLLIPTLAVAEWKGDLYDLVTVYSENSKDAPAQLKAIENQLIKGADSNEARENTPIVFKALNPNQVKVLNLLIRYKANLNGRDRDDYTPLMRASYSTAAIHPNDLSVVKTLLDNKADPNLSNKNHMTALHLAAANVKPNESVELIKVLLKSGANPNVLMGPGGRNAQIAFSPMANAAKKGNMAVVQLLAEAKADPNLKGPKGISPLTAAKQSEHSELEKLIQSLGGHE
jgi:ankyrin repeat protein